MCFYLWNLPVENRTCNRVDDPTHPPWIFCQACFTWETVMFCMSFICLPVCLSGFANFCAHFYASGAASPVCLSVCKVLAPKGLCTLHQPSKMMNLFHRSLKQVVNLTCFCLKLAKASCHKISVKNDTFFASLSRNLIFKLLAKP